MSRFAGSKHGETRGESGRAFLSGSGRVSDAGARRSSRPNGYLVYLAEAAGRERSHRNLPQQMRAHSPFVCISVSATAATFRPCPPELFVVKFSAVLVMKNGADWKQIFGVRLL